MLSVGGEEERSNRKRKYKSKMEKGTEKKQMVTSKKAEDTAKKIRTKKQRGIKIRSQPR